MLTLDSCIAITFVSSLAEQLTPLLLTRSLRQANRQRAFASHQSITLCVCSLYPAGTPTPWVPHMAVPLFCCTLSQPAVVPLHPSSAAPSITTPRALSKHLHVPGSSYVSLLRCIGAASNNAALFCDGAGSQIQRTSRLGPGSRTWQSPVSVRPLRTDRYCSLVSLPVFCALVVNRIKSRYLASRFAKKLAR